MEKFITYLLLNIFKISERGRMASSSCCCCDEWIVSNWGGATANPLNQSIICPSGRHQRIISTIYPALVQPIISFIHHQFICLSILPGTHPTIHSSIHKPSNPLPNHPSIHPFIHPFVHILILSSIHSSNYSSIHPSVQPPIHPSIHPPVHPPIHSSIHPLFIR